MITIIFLSIIRTTFNYIRTYYTGIGIIDNYKLMFNYLRRRSMHKFNYEVFDLFFINEIQM